MISHLNTHLNTHTQLTHLCLRYTQIAVERNRLQVVKYLLNHCRVGHRGLGASDTPLLSPMDSTVSLALSPLLHTMVSQGNIDMVRVMLEARHRSEHEEEEEEEDKGLMEKVFDVNEQRGEDGATPLFLACNINSESSGLKKAAITSESVQAEIVRCLLDEGACPNLEINTGHRPLYLAAQVG
jgi:ankyrin repeat protein